MSTPTISSSPSQKPPLPAHYKWKVLGTVMTGFFMILLDITVINVAFPALRQEFGANLNEAQWIISVYSMAMGVSMPLAGFLADRVGSKTLYLSALGIFLAGSLFCGLATNLYMLVAARIVQGIGGGIALPLGIALLLQAFPTKEQGNALGIYGIAALAAPALGPVMGGWLVGLDLWRVIFFLNLPVGAAALLLGQRFLRQRLGQARPPFDVPGIISSTIGFGSVLYAASIAADLGWTAPQTLMWFGIGAAGLLAFVVVELFFAAAPLLDLRLFKNRIFLNASMLGFVATWALFGAEFLLPLYLQNLRGQSGLATGIILLPMAITSGVLVMLSGRIYDRIGPRAPVTLGFAILAVNTWQLANLQADTSIEWILFLLALRGIALGLSTQTTMAAALSVVPPARLPMGSSLINSTRQVVMSLGVAVLATVLANAISPEARALQNQIGSQAHAAGESASFALCKPAPNAVSLLPQPQAAPNLPTDALLSPAFDPALVQRACQENINGFENSYQLTFYASLLAVVLGAFLPGWPLKWAGRQNHDPIPAGH